jgi:Ca2+-binding RTX toxin-like protein
MARLEKLGARLSGRQADPSMIADVLTGGPGDDFHMVDDPADTIVEGVGMGNDVVIASVSYVLNGGAEVEYLITEDGNGTATRNLTGNEFAQQIWGNQGDNILAGAGGNDTLIGFGGNDYLDGGAGKDDMIGGLGDDIYITDTNMLNNIDVVIEVDGEGFDIFVAPIGGTLTAGASIELITTGWIGGTTQVSIRGNAFGQHMWGNDGVNFLRGEGGDDTLFGFGGNDELSGGDGDDLMFGGAGSDSLQGGAGDDYYVLDDPSDSIHELQNHDNGGYDTVVAPFSFVFDAGDHVELVTTGFIAGTAAIDYTGEDDDTEFWGNDGANVIDGGFGEDVIIGFGGNDIIDGGGHNDILIGGTGQDIFRFTIVPSNTLNFNNIDTIGDYSVADDSIQLDDIVYSALPQGALNPAAFVLGTAAADADDRIIYDAATGRLFYDADGNGAGMALHFATVTAGTAITAAEFTVI